LSDVIVSGNRVGGSSIGGGGIFNVGDATHTATLTLTNCVVSGNTAGGGMIPVNGPITGGGIRNANSGSLTLTNTTVSNNTAQVGGGIFNTGTLTVTGSTFSGNSAGVGVSTMLLLEGGGIYVNGPSSGTIINSTFSGNQAKDDGGGIANAGTLSVSDSTFSGNIAQGGGAHGGAVSVIGHTLTLKNSILANSPLGGNCFVSGGALMSDGNNLSNDGTCSLTDLTDKPNTAAGLDPLGLQNNGGPTQTIALLSSSVAKDAGSCTAVGGGVVSADQRGVPRPQPLGGMCGSLRQAIMDASGGDAFSCNEPRDHHHGTNAREGTGVLPGRMSYRFPL